MLSLLLSAFSICSLPLECYTITTMIHMAFRKHLHQCINTHRTMVMVFCRSQALLPDQLSVAHGVNALFQLANGSPPAERLEGLCLDIANKHAENKFPNVHHNFSLFSLTNQLKLTKVDLLRKTIAQIHPELSCIHKHPLF